jgi:hypothetical protein
MNISESCQTANHGSILANVESEARRMDAVVIGATLLGSFATAFVVQKAVLGAVLRAFGRDKAHKL